MISSPREYGLSTGLYNYLLSGLSEHEQEILHSKKQWVWCMIRIRDICWGRQLAEDRSAGGWHTSSARGSYTSLYRVSIRGWTGLSGYEEEDTPETEMIVTMSPLRGRFEDDRLFCHRTPLQPDRTYLVSIFRGLG